MTKLLKWRDDLRIVTLVRVTLLCVLHGTILSLPTFNLGAAASRWQHTIVLFRSYGRRGCSGWYPPWWIQIFFTIVRLLGMVGFTIVQ